MSEELKPCPFCGYADIRRHQFGDFRAVPCCTECGVAVIGGDWNRRPQPAAQAVPDIAVLVDRFLSWPLPESFCAYQHRTWANLMNSEEARAMFEHVLSAAPTPPEVEQRRDLLDWAVTSWHEQVAQRPLVNVHRRTLDSVWRQVIAFAGGDAESLIGPRHDDLLNERGEVPALPEAPAQEVRS